MQLLEILQYIANASCYTTRYQRPYEQSGFHFFSKIVQREREKEIYTVRAGILSRNRDQVQYNF